MGDFAPFSVFLYPGFTECRTLFFFIDSLHEWHALVLDKLWVVRKQRVCVRVGLAVHGRAVFHKAVALVPFVDRLHERHDKRRRKDVEAQQTQRHGEAAGIDRA